jgi:lipopolysaccharide export system protein LptC
MLLTRLSRRYLNADRGRSPRTIGRNSRRLFVINLTKYLFPIGALILLSLIALWPEIQTAATKARLKIANVSGDVEGGKIIDARYNGIDQIGRPYTLTAVAAWQGTSEYVDMTWPSGDVLLGNGSWLMLTSKSGRFLQRLSQLDMSDDVTLYRDDGTVMRTESATIDLKAGAAVGSQPVHVEGPFGTLEAQGFTVMDKGAAVDFPGPAHVVLNGGPR